jgi:tRNA-dihydrouridine synthase A
MRPLLPAYRFSVAPMMDWTDRHCRYFHRQFSKNMLLYTEMVTAQALVYGDSHRFLQHSECEHPLALQLGGSDPEFLAKAVKIAEPYGFCEINLNVGCPSDRVQSGRFGACLMREPELVAECFEAMQKASNSTSTEITIKCRIGVDDQDPNEVLPDFVSKISAVGCKRFVIHARKALLKGLSPKDNRTIPTHNCDLAYLITRENPDLVIILNGG